MRTFLRGLLILSGVGAAASGVAACGTCKGTDSCGTYVPPGIVAGGGSNASGASGDGNGGASGDEQGGTSGTSTAGGSSSGASGRGGSHSGGSAGKSGVAGSSGDAGEAGSGIIPCNTTKRPSEEACIVSNDFAIFVAPTGRDTAGGTTTAPVKTIAKAIELAGDAKIVIACDGTYDEQVKLTTGAKLYGGFSCPGSATPWSYELGKRATVASAARGVALSISSGASSVVIEDFEFDAKDGVDPGESSVAAFVNASTSVALARVKLVAGKGANGADGTLTKVTTFPTQLTLNGHAASGDTGGMFNQYVCPVGGTTTGAAGGNGSAGLTGGGAGLPALGGGSGGNVTVACNAGGGGGDGANAPPKPPAPGAPQIGTITAAGWAGASGTDGAPGSPGQGGGGGTGASTGGGGGGGGAGGCGGAGGTGGKAGGSSIALLVLNSTLSMTTNELIAANAGKGGNGVAGQDGQPEFGAPGAGSSFGCGGGKGGQGGAGGAGGGAAGGISVGIAYRGMAPAPDVGTLITAGTAGTKGIGGVAGTNDGIDGKAQKILEVP